MFNVNISTSLIAQQPRCLSLGFQLYWAHCCPFLALPFPTEQGMFVAKNSYPQGQTTPFLYPFPNTRDLGICPQMTAVFTCMHEALHRMGEDPEWEGKGRWSARILQVASCSRLKYVRGRPDHLNSKAHSLTLSSN